MQRVVDGTDRAELDSSTAEPVQDPARKLVMAECAAIVEADIPAETIASESVRQPANLLRLFKQQDFVIQPGKCSGRRHSAHAGPDNNHIELVC